MPNTLDHVKNGEIEFLSSILHVTIISPFVEYLIDVCSFVVRLLLCTCTWYHCQHEHRGMVLIE